MSQDSIESSIPQKDSTSSNCSQTTPTPPLPTPPTQSPPPPADSDPKTSTSPPQEPKPELPKPQTLEPNTDHYSDLHSADNSDSEEQPDDFERLIPLIDKIERQAYGMGKAGEKKKSFEETEKGWYEKWCDEEEEVEYGDMGLLEEVEEEIEQSSLSDSQESTESQDSQTETPSIIPGMEIPVWDKKPINYKHNKVDPRTVFGICCVQNISYTVFGAPESEDEDGEDRWRKSQRQPWDYTQMQKELEKMELEKMEAGKQDVEGEEASKVEVEVKVQKQESDESTYICVIGKGKEVEKTV